MSNGGTAAMSSSRDALRPASSTGSLTAPAICSYSAARVRGSRPARRAAITGAPGQTCSMGSHVLRPTRIFMRVACWQISASSAVFPMPAGPEICTLELVPCWQAPRRADSALAIGSLRPRNGPARIAPPQETASLLVSVTEARSAAHRQLVRSLFGAVTGDAGQLAPGPDSRLLEDVAKVGADRVR